MFAWRFEGFQHSDKCGNLFMSSDSAELSLGYEQSGADPALALITAVPAFDVATDRFDDREGRFNQVGAGQRLAKLLGDMQLENSQSFFQPFAKAARGAGIQIHQFAVQAFERL